MKKGVVVLIVAVILIAITMAGILIFGNKNDMNVTGGNNSNNSPAGNKINSVELKNFAFSPLTLTIKAGESVIWTNLDSAPHTITSDSGSELDSQSFSKDETYSHTFNTAGTYSYHCKIHPSMKGKIIVE